MRTKRGYTLFMFGRQGDMPYYIDKLEGDIKLVRKSVELIKSRNTWSDLFNLKDSEDVDYNVSKYTRSRMKSGVKSTVDKIDVRNLNIIVDAILVNSKNVVDISNAEFRLNSDYLSTRKDLYIYTNSSLERLKLVVEIENSVANLYVYYSIPKHNRTAKLVTKIDKVNNGFSYYENSKSKLVVSMKYEIEVSKYNSNLLSLLVESCSTKSYEKIQNSVLLIDKLPFSLQKHKQCEIRTYDSGIISMKLQSLYFESGGVKSSYSIRHSYEYNNDSAEILRLYSDISSNISTEGILSYNMLKLIDTSRIKILNYTDKIVDIYKQNLDDELPTIMINDKNKTTVSLTKYSSTTYRIIESNGLLCTMYYIDRDRYIFKHVKSGVFRVVGIPGVIVAKKISIYTVMISGVRNLNYGKLFAKFFNLKSGISVAEFTERFKVTIVNHIDYNNTHSKLVKLGIAFDNEPLHSLKYLVDIAANNKNLYITNFDEFYEIASTKNKAVFSLDEYNIFYTFSNNRLVQFEEIVDKVLTLKEYGETYNLITTKELTTVYDLSNLELDTVNLYVIYNSYRLIESLSHNTCVYLYDDLDLMQNALNLLEYRVNYYNSEDTISLATVVENMIVVKYVDHSSSVEIFAEDMKDLIVRICSFDYYAERDIYPFKFISSLSFTDDNDIDVNVVRKLNNIYLFDRNNYNHDTIMTVTTNYDLVPDIDTESFNIRVRVNDGYLVFSQIAKSVRTNLEEIIYTYLVHKEFVQNSDYKSIMSYIHAMFNKSQSHDRLLYTLNLLKLNLYIVGFREEYYVVDRFNSTKYFNSIYVLRYRLESDVVYRQLGDPSLVINPLENFITENVTDLTISRTKTIENIYTLYDVFTIEEHDRRRLNIEKYIEQDSIFERSIIQHATITTKIFNLEEKLGRETIDEIFSYLAKFVKDVELDSMVRLDLLSLREGNSYEYKSVTKHQSTIIMVFYGAKSTILLTDPEDRSLSLEVKANSIVIFKDTVSQHSMRFDFVSNKSIVMIYTNFL